MAISLILLLAGSIVVLVYWKIMNLYVRAFSLGILLIGTLIIYPLWKFSVALEKIDPAFRGGKCVLAIQESTKGLDSEYSTLSEFVIGNTVGYTPKFYFLSTIGICKFQLQQYSASAEALTMALEYAKTNSFDNNHIEKAQSLLERALRKMVISGSHQGK